MSHQQENQLAAKSTHQLTAEPEAEGGLTASPPGFSLSAGPMQAQLAADPVQLTDDPNAILNDLTTSGAGRGTTKQDGAHHTDYGVPASERMAETDQERILRFADVFVEVANSFGLPPALLAAIASRETRGRNLLFGDHGNGVGMMQVDVRYHPDRAAAIRNAANEREQIRLGITYGAQILKDSLEGVRAKHPTWSAAWQLRGAVAAYNFGVDDVGTQERLDVGSTGDDYSADVWARARYYAAFAEFGSAAEVEAAASATPESSSSAGGGMMDWLSDKWDSATETAGDMVESASEMLGSAKEMVSNGWDWATSGFSKEESSEQAMPQFRETIALSGSVGAGGANTASDVWQVQAKLHHLGYLSDAAWNGEVRATLSIAANQAIPESQLTETIAALRTFQSQQTTGFTPDGLVSPGYSTLKALNENVHRDQVTRQPEGANETVSGNSNYSVDLAVAALESNAHDNSTGYCARYVRMAINAGGIATPNNPVSAYLYNGYLEQFGFVQVPAGSYQAGDIAVIENFGTHRHGHIQMYNGSQWISDFRQRDFWPGSSYRTTQPPFVIYRMP